MKMSSVPPFAFSKYAAPGSKLEKVQAAQWRDRQRRLHASDSDEDDHVTDEDDHEDEASDSPNEEADEDDDDIDEGQDSEEGDQDEEEADNDDEGLYDYLASLPEEERISFLKA
jgi:hypothetical protein